MIRKIILFLATLLIFGGCVTIEKSLNKNTAEKKKPNWLIEFPSSRYLTATATDIEEMGARQSALSELANIFDSRVISVTENRVESNLIQGKPETINRNTIRDIRILSSVQLKGAKIAAIRFDTSEELYHAIAILDRNLAKINWKNDLRKIDRKLIILLESFNLQKSNLSRLQSLKKIHKQWLEYQIISSRLSILGFSYSNSTHNKIRASLRKKTLLKANILFYIDGGKNRGANFIVTEMSKNLGISGYAITTNEDTANVIIRGTVTVSPVKLDNDNFEFARVTASFSILDKESNLIVGKISENKRVGHLNFDEASHKALQKVADIVSKQLIAYFE